MQSNASQSVSQSAGQGVSERRQSMQGHESASERVSRSVSQAAEQQQRPPASPPPPLTNELPVTSGAGSEAMGVALAGVTRADR